MDIKRRDEILKEILYIFDREKLITDDCLAVLIDALGITAKISARKFGLEFEKKGKLFNEIVKNISSNFTLFLEEIKDEK